MTAALQLSLFGREAPSAGGFARAVRTELDEASWLEHVPGFVQGHATLFEALRERVAWHEERRVMYEREVAVPRLVAGAPVSVHPLVAQVAGLLRHRYGAEVERIGLALYRHGQDSVAWHRDKMHRDRPTLVAIVSLGAPRRFLVRAYRGSRAEPRASTGGGPSRSFSLGLGDLFVMGGLCQARWEHHVPKVISSEPRMSLMFRHEY
jgi:alkylated DNA repair dioxygenase AlkB